MGQVGADVLVEFDEQVFVMQRRGGISRSFVELIHRFAADPQYGVAPTLPVRLVSNEHAAAGLGALGVRAVRGTAGQRLMSARVRLRRPRPGGGADLLHHTYYHPAYLPDRPGVPKVVTVHDMIPELLGLSPNPHLAKREYVATADLVLVNSEATLADLVTCYGTPRAPVAVTPFGVDLAMAELAGGERPLPDPYLVFVGQRSGYKDFATLAAAHRLAAEVLPELLLVAVGGGSWRPDEAPGPGVSRVDASDRELATLLRHCAAYVMPSRFEGFGLPVLEAMVCGAPVITASGPAQREVAGAAARYFSPGDAAELADVVLSVVTDPGEAARLATAGRTRAAMFPWEATCRATAEAYGTVA